MRIHRQRAGCRLTLAVARSLLSATAFLLLLPTPGPAQQFLDDVKKRAEAAARDEALVQVDELVRDRIRCVFSDEECIRKARESGEDYVLTDEGGEVVVDEDGAPVTDPDSAGAIMEGSSDLSTLRSGVAPGLDEVDAKYDFESGDETLFEDDYAADNLGDFPRRMELSSGNWDVVEWNGRRWLRNTGPRHSAIAVPLPDTLPQTFTIEFDAYFPHENQQLLVATAVPDGGARQWKRLPGNAFQIGVAADRTGIVAPSGDGVQATVTTEEVGRAPVPIRIMVDGRHAKMFVSTRRVANVPNAEFMRGDRVLLINTYFANEKNPMLLGPVRIAAGGRELYDVLVAEGRFTARGIQFDVNSAVIRPESGETLEEIGRMLGDHPDLGLSIEGHTDSDGDDAYNLTLSNQRAEAVRDYLVDRFAIAPERLLAEGFGETRPVASNETADGKQQNRRVVLVRR